MILIGYQGIGKSTLAYKNNNYIDLESSNFYHNDKRPDNWYIYYCNIATSLSIQGFDIFVSSHEVVRNRLKKYNKIITPIYCIYPSLELKDDWIKKLEDRYNKDKNEKNYKAWMNAVNRYEENILEIMNSGFGNIEITSMYYNLENLIDNYVRRILNDR